MSDSINRKGVIFDMDGLLIDSESCWMQANVEVLSDVGIELTKEEYVQTIGLPTHEAIEIYSSYKDFGKIKLIDISSKIIARAEEIILDQSKLMEGVLGTLDLLDRENYKIGLASSSPKRMIEAVINKHGIRDFFGAVHSAEEHEYGKPHPAVYLECSKDLKIDPIDCLVFEDSITGMISAKAAKMKVIVVPDKNNYDDERYSLADLKIRSLQDFSIDLV